MIRPRTARWLGGVIAAAVLALAPRPAAGQSVTLTELKAAFVSSFAPFVEWPSAALAGDAPLFICVVNDPAVAQSLERNSSGRNVGGHRVEVRALAGDASTAGCQILYIAGTDFKRSLDTTAGTPVFTIGDAPDFSTSGGMVRLVRRDNRLKFEINLDAIQRSGLKLSARVLILAETVRDAHGVVAPEKH